MNSIIRQSKTSYLTFILRLNKYHINLLIAKYLTNIPSCGRGTFYLPKHLPTLQTYRVVS